MPLYPQVTVAHVFDPPLAAVLVFDEIEDVFPFDLGALLFGMSSSETRPAKGGLTRALEHNPIPTIWIANHVHHIDPAYLRRFDYSVEFPVPPKSNGWGRPSSGSHKCSRRRARRTQC